MVQACALDPDTLRLVLGYLEHDKGLLSELSLLNKGVHSLVRPILYRFNTFVDTTRVIQFCKTLRDNPQSYTPLVRKLHVPHLDGSRKFIWCDEAHLMVQLIHAVLPLLPNLYDLRISGSEFESKHPLSQMPFFLRSLTLLLPTTVSIGEFFQTQKSLKRLELCATRGRANRTNCLDLREVADRSLLPSLNTLSACSGAFVALAPDRPITRAALNSCGWHSALMPSVISAIDESTASIEALRVDLRSIRDARCVDFVSNLASTKAAPTLETLTLITTGLDDDYWMPPEGQPSGPLTPPPELFSRFGALRSLVIEKPVWDPQSQFYDLELGDRPPPEPEYDSVWSDVQSKESWETSCRTLNSVRIYGKKLDLGARGS